MSGRLSLRGSPRGSDLPAADDAFCVSAIDCRFEMNLLTPRVHGDDRLPYLFSLTAQEAPSTHSKAEAGYELIGRTVRAHYRSVEIRELVGRFAHTAIVPPGR